MRKITFPLTVLLIALGSVTLWAQSLRPLDQVREAHATGSFEMELQPLKLFNGRAAVPELDAQRADYSVLEVDRVALRDLAENAPEQLILDLPQAGRSSRRLELVRVDLFSPEFEITLSSTDTYAKVDAGLHYRGILAGDENSIVAVSFSGDEVMGLIATETGNLVIGKIKGDAGDRHVLYNDHDMPTPDLGQCMVVDDLENPYSRDELDDIHTGGRDANNCVGIFLEVDNDIYLGKGSKVSTVTNFITGLFNQVAVLYANEQINITLSGMKIWDGPDPYKGSNAGIVLDKLMEKRTSFAGNLAAHVSFGVSGGIGYVDVLCPSPYSSTTYGYSVSGIRDAYQDVPSYSWSVNVLAHELGHNFGSRHTQACVWNGDASALDGCYPSEGSCSDGPIPNNGGTIMSYCHLKNGVGINFTKGFGDQPGALIRNRTYNASCLTSCGDGGGDGGDPPPPPPSGGDDCVNVSVVIKTDNYPTETSWKVKDAAGVTVMQGGSYSARFATFTADKCLPAGCYDFIITDSYGDGICCSYGEGAYSVEVDGAVLASGGNFTTKQTKNFCLELSGGGGDGGGGDDPTDGACAPLNFNNYPPISFGGNEDKGTVTKIDKNTIYLTGNAWKAVNMPYQVTRNTYIEFEFKSNRRGEVHGIGFDEDNRITSTRTFRVYGTQTWGVSKYSKQYPGSEGTWESYRIRIGEKYTGSFKYLFFAMDHDSGSRDGDSFFRNIRIFESDECIGFTPAADNSDEDRVFGAGSLTVYPNPTSNEVTAAFDLPTAGRTSVEVYNLQGQRVHEENSQMDAGPRQFRLQVGHLPVGTYLLRLTSESGYQSTGRFTVAR